MNTKVSNIVEEEQDNISLVNIDNATEYLLNHGLVETKSIVDGDLKIIDASRRNRNLQVIRKNDTSFLLKQPNPTDINSIMTIKKEALLYLLMQTNSDFVVLKDIAPRILDFDDQKNILVTEFVTNAQSLNNYYYYHSSQGMIGKEEPAELGRLIAAYHKAFNGLIKDSNSNNDDNNNKENNNNNSNKSKLHFLREGFVPVAGIVRPGPEIFKDISAGNLKLLKIIQQYPAFYDSLEELYSSWHPQTLVHGDIKWDNVIISPSDESSKTSFRMNIVDWESASIGDPAWDIGSVFQEFIKFWLYLLPTTGRESAEQLIMSTAHPISNIQSALRSFWNSYTRYAKIDANESNELLIRSAKFCAARLVQSAYESLYSSMEVPNNIIYMIQTSLNIFDRTDKAIIQLLGIPFRSERMA